MWHALSSQLRKDVSQNELQTSAGVRMAMDHGISNGNDYCDGDDNNDDGENGDDDDDDDDDDNDDDCDNGDDDVDDNGDND